MFLLSVKKEIITLKQSASRGKGLEKFWKSFGKTIFQDIAVLKDSFFRTLTKL